MKKKILILSSSLLLVGALQACTSAKKNSEILGVSSDSLLSDSQSTTSNTSTSINTGVPDEHELEYQISNGEGTFESNQSSTPNIASPSTIQEGTILHAWNWSMTNIKNNMALIAKAGYTAVQTSPMQPQKDYAADETVNNWWKLYQPLGFSIATKNNAIGTKDELKEMVKEADKYGVKVIVDVVANHLAGASTSGTTKLHPDVKEYEPEIYGTGGSNSSGALLHAKTSTGASDSSGISVTQGNIGMPDLDTANPVVQQRVLSLLKEYIDCGVDGFRFDAAKHIETPTDDDSFKSNFWTTVLEGAQTYATNTGKGTIYNYGEILNTAGSGRSYSSYTSMMSVTDNVFGNTIRTLINGGLTSGFTTLNYASGVSADKAVLWAESHDTYAENTSSSVSMKNIDKAYAYTASLNQSSSLYFARPNAGNLSSGQVRLGEVGTDYWRSSAITAINKYHNYFNGEDSSLSMNNNVFMNLRQKGSTDGLVVIDLQKTNATNAVNCTVPSEFKDGTYLDQVSGRTMTVSSGVLNETLDSSGIAVLVNYDCENVQIYDAPVLEASVGSTKYATETFQDTYTIKNASKAFMQVDDEDPVEITSGASININKLTLSYSCKVTITVEGLDGSKIVKVFRYKHYDPDQEFVVYFVNKTNLANVYIYLWNDATQVAETKWSGNPMTLYGKTEDGKYDIYTYSIDTTRYDRLIFNNNGSTQTIDLVLNKEVNMYELASTKDSQGHYNVITSVYEG